MDPHEDKLLVPLLNLKCVSKKSHFTKEQQIFNKALLDICFLLKA